jgi:hypothetical protein
MSNLSSSAYLAVRKEAAAGSYYWRLNNARSGHYKKFASIAGILRFKCGIVRVGVSVQ